MEKEVHAAQDTDAAALETRRRKWRRRRRRRRRKQKEEMMRKMNMEEGTSGKGEEWTMLDEHEAKQIKQLIIFCKDTPRELVPSLADTLIGRQATQGRHTKRDEHDAAARKLVDATAAKMLLDAHVVGHVSREEAAELLRGLGALAKLSPSNARFFACDAGAATRLAQLLRMLSAPTGEEKRDAAHVAEPAAELLTLLLKQNAGLETVEALMEPIIRAIDSDDSDTDDDDDINDASASDDDCKDADTARRHGENDTAANCADEDAVASNGSAAARQRLSGEAGTIRAENSNTNGGDDDSTDEVDDQGETMWIESVLWSMRGAVAGGSARGRPGHHHHHGGRGFASSPSTSSDAPRCFFDLHGEQAGLRVNGIRNFPQWGYTLLIWFRFSYERGQGVAPLFSFRAANGNGIDCCVGVGSGDVIVRVYHGNRNTVDREVIQGVLTRNAGGAGGGATDASGTTAGGHGEHRNEWRCLVLSHYRPTLGFRTTIDVHVDGREVASGIALRYPKIGTNGKCSFWLGAGTIEQGRGFDALQGQIGVSAFFGVTASADEMATLYKCSRGCRSPLAAYFSNHNEQTSATPNSTWMCTSGDDTGSAAALPRRFFSAGGGPRLNTIFVFDPRACLKKSRCANLVDACAGRGIEVRNLSNTDVYADLSEGTSVIWTKPLSKMMSVAGGPVILLPLLLRREHADALRRRMPSGPRFRALRYGDGLRMSTYERVIDLCMALLPSMNVGGDNLLHSKDTFLVALSAILHGVPSSFLSPAIARCLNAFVATDAVDATCRVLVLKRLVLKPSLWVRAPLETQIELYRGVPDLMIKLFSSGQVHGAHGSSSGGVHHHHHQHHGFGDSAGEKAAECVAVFRMLLDALSIYDWERNRELVRANKLSAAHAVALQQMILRPFTIFLVENHGDEHLHILKAAALKAILGFLQTESSPNYVSPDAESGTSGNDNSASVQPLAIVATAAHTVTSCAFKELRAWCDVLHDGERPTTTSSSGSGKSPLCVSALQSERSSSRSSRLGSQRGGSGRLGVVIGVNLIRHTRDREARLAGLRLVWLSLLTFWLDKNEGKSQTAADAPSSPRSARRGADSVATTGAAASEGGTPGQPQRGQRKYCVSMAMDVSSAVFSSLRRRLHVWDDDTAGPRDDSQTMSVIEARTMMAMMCIGPPLPPTMEASIPTKTEVNHHLESLEAFDGAHIDGQAALVLLPHLLVTVSCPGCPEDVVREVMRTFSVLFRNTANLDIIIRIQGLHFMLTRVARRAALERVNGREHVTKEFVRYLLPGSADTASSLSPISKARAESSNIGSAGEAWYVLMNVFLYVIQKPVVDPTKVNKLLYEILLGHETEAGISVAAGERAPDTCTMLLAVVLLSKLKASIGTQRGSSSNDDAANTRMLQRLVLICRFMQCAFHRVLFLHGKAELEASLAASTPPSPDDDVEDGDPSRAYVASQLVNLMAWAWTACAEASTIFVADVLAKDPVTSFDATWLAVHAAGSLLPVTIECRNIFGEELSGGANANGDGFASLGQAHISFNNWLYDIGILSFDESGVTVSAEKLRAGVDMLSVLTNNLLGIIAKICNADAASLGQMEKLQLDVLTNIAATLLNALARYEVEDDNRRKVFLETSLELQETSPDTVLARVRTSRLNEVRQMQAAASLSLDKHVSNGIVQIRNESKTGVDAVVRFVGREARADELGARGIDTTRPGPVRRVSSAGGSSAVAKSLLEPTSPSLPPPSPRADTWTSPRERLETKLTESNEREFAVLEKVLIALYRTPGIWIHGPDKMMLGQFVYKLASRESSGRQRMRQKVDWRGVTHEGAALSMGGGGGDASNEDAAYGAPTPDEDAAHIDNESVDDASPVAVQRRGSLHSPMSFQTMTALVRAKKQLMKLINDDDDDPDASTVLTVDASLDRDKRTDAEEDEEVESRRLDFDHVSSSSQVISMDSVQPALVRTKSREIDVEPLSTLPPLELPSSPSASTTTTATRYEEEDGTDITSTDLSSESTAEATTTSTSAHDDDVGQSAVSQTADRLDDRGKVASSASGARRPDWSLLGEISRVATVLGGRLNSVTDGSVLSRVTGFVVLVDLVMSGRIVRGQLSVLSDSVVFWPENAVTSKDDNFARQASRQRTWKMDQVCAMQIRRFLLERTAVEIFLKGGKSLLVHTRSLDVGSNSPILSMREYNTEKRSLQQLQRQIVQKSSARRLLQPQVLVRRSEWTKAWQKGQLSNFEYLMLLNAAAGRSYQDLTQYPVFPWILTDYTSSTIDLKDPSVYRDLSKPVGALNPTRLERLLDRFESMEDDPENPPFIYGSHYSTMGAVLYYMIRSEPFTTLAIELQGGRFDFADRLFHSVAETFKNCNEMDTDVKELIPEFFYSADFLRNRNRVTFGERQDGTILGDVALPPWAQGSADTFVRVNRAALESAYVSAHLHEWIDLIFGHLQRGPNAIEANNLFHYLTYEGCVDLESVDDPIMRESVEAQIANFGQIPMQLFTKPHPPRSYSPSLPMQDAYYLSFKGSTVPTFIDPIASFGADVSPFGSAVLCEKSRPVFHVIKQDGTLSSYVWTIATVASTDPASSGAMPGSTSGEAVVSRRPVAETLYNVSDALPDLHELADLVGAYCGSHDGVVVSQQQLMQVVSFDTWAASNVDRSGKVSDWRRSVSQPTTVLTAGHWDGSVMAHTFTIDKNVVARSVMCVHPSSCVTCLSVSEDASVLVCGDADGLVAVYDLGVPCTLRRVLVGHSTAVTSVAVSNHMDVVLSGDAAGTAVVHSLSKGSVLHVFKPPALLDDFSVSVVSIGPACGEYLVGLSLPKSSLMRVFSHNGDVMAEAPVPGQIMSTAFSTCGRYVMIADSVTGVSISLIHSMQMEFQLKVPSFDGKALGNGDVGAGSAELSLCKSAGFTVDGTHALVSLRSGGILVYCLPR